MILQGARDKGSDTIIKIKIFHKKKTYQTLLGFNYLIKPIYFDNFVIINSRNFISYWHKKISLNINLQISLIPWRFYY